MGVLHRMTVLEVAMDGGVGRSYGAGGWRSEQHMSQALLEQEEDVTGRHGSSLIQSQVQRHVPVLVDPDTMGLCVFQTLHSGTLRDPAQGWRR